MDITICKELIELITKLRLRNILHEFFLDDSMVQFSSHIYDLNKLIPKISNIFSCRHLDFWNDFMFE